MSYTDETVKYLKKYGWIFLIMIVIFSAVWFRAYTIYLPVTDDWAKDSVYRAHQNQIINDIKRDYPNLPEAETQKLAVRQFNELLEYNNDEINKQIQDTSLYFKSQFQDDSGQTYLLAIDPYLWYTSSRNYVENGHWGNELKDGVSYDTLRGRTSREGRQAWFTLFPFLTVINYKVMNIYSETSVMTAAFYMPLILIALAAVSAFFIGRRIYGNSAGLVAGVIVGLHSALLNRTVAGFSDTDNIIAVCELATIALFVYAFSEDIKWKKWLYLVLSGFVMAVYGIGHPSWWHIFDTILGCLGLWLLYQLFKYRKEFKNKTKEIFNTIYLGVGFVLSTWVFYVTFRVLTGVEFIVSLKNVIFTPLTAPFAFLKMKDVAITSIWPNVMTTVAELNKSSMNNVIGQMGGMILFSLAVIGLLLLLYRTENKFRVDLFYGLLFTAWFMSACFASLGSMRFIAMLVPAFALGVASSVGYIYKYLGEQLSIAININVNLIRGLIILICCVIIFVPLATGANSVARSEVPSMNDGWKQTLTNIDADTDNGYITSWWDFGHWFVAMSRQRVTFDGGDQGERIYWVGKALLESEEKQAVGILRMLNCGQSQAPHVLTEFLGENNDVKSINILDAIFSLNEEEAKQKYISYGLEIWQAEKMLTLTHCDDLYDQYFITSEDMVAKAGVWAHFGSWDFEKANMFNKVKGKKYNKGVSLLEIEFNMTESEAIKTFNQIDESTGDEWISGWPGYISGVRRCNKDNRTLTCSQGIQGNLFNIVIDLDTMNYSIPESNGFVLDSIVYVDGNNTVKRVNEKGNTGISITLIPDNDQYNSILSSTILADSLFTKLFFMNGLGTTKFNMFNNIVTVTGQRVITWKVDLDE